MSDFWRKYGKRIAIIWYVVALVTQISVALFTFETLQQKVVMTVIFFVMTTACIWGAYKVTNKILLR